MKRREFIQLLSSIPVVATTAYLAPQLLFQEKITSAHPRKAVVGVASNTLWPGIEKFFNEAYYKHHTNLFFIQE